MPPTSRQKAPLKNIRVLDLSRVFAMPFAAANLADLGAEVIKIDTCQNQFMDTTRTITGPFPDNLPGELWWEQGGTFQNLNRGKRSLTLDLRSEESQKIIKELVGVCDVVLENFTPRVMARFGLDFESLRAHKPDLIMVSNTGYGHNGPWSNFGAMASALEPTHGTGAFMGYMEEGEDGRLTEGQVPNKMGNSYSDFMATWTALGSLMAALLRRARTGQGQWIDLAMYQTGATVIGTGLLDYAFNGRRTLRIGNRHPVWSPHGVYPCEGQDQWVAIAARDESDWQAVCQAMGKPELTFDPRFGEPITRRQNQEELDAVISAWTSARTSFQVMETLQQAGAPAGAVLTAKQVLIDPQHLDRGFFETVHNPPESGLRDKGYVGRGWRFSKNEATIRGPAPLLGEANDYVLGELLGVDDDSLKRFAADWTIGNLPEGGSAPGTVPLDEQVELGWIAEYDADYLDLLPPV
ncbi:MAG: CoA transferase [SAR202 cluster bacterium]|nr:CoA transferase [Dehalococcoidia bacterium]MQF89218.1 CoA transferase [SAR202 cluster bacterium]